VLYSARLTVPLQRRTAAEGGRGALTRNVGQQPPRGVATVLRRYAALHRLGIKSLLRFPRHARTNLLVG
jgi:hypothetical protein